MSTLLADQIHWLLQDVERFCARGGGLHLRAYQKAVAHSVIQSVVGRKGHSIVVMFPRQSGKNELQAQIEAYLLTVLSHTPAEIVKVSPTWKPQSLNAMRRLQRVLEKNLVTRGRWQKEQGYIYRLGQARIFFFSGAPEANIVGATASTLLQVDEAQDVEIAKFDKDIAPMAASTNATRVFWGTAWTSRTLLARELRSAREAERRDGIRRVFQIDASVVEAEVPAYGAFVAEQVARLGRNSPMVKTQFFSEEVDAEGGLFNAGRLALLAGEHPAQVSPRGGAIYALLLDVAGEDEGLNAESGALSNPGRDATALTIVEVDLGTLKDPLIQRPTYRVVQRRQWLGIKHASLYAELRAQVELWRARWLVVDATGVGAGVASFLSNAFPQRVIAFTFTQGSKSQLGWDFTALVDGGRWKEHHPAGAPADQAQMQRAFFNQLSFCQYEILPGPAKTMRWGVADGMRDPASGDLLHDDWVLSAALSVVLDAQSWAPGGAAAVVQRSDPLKELDHGF